MNKRDLVDWVDAMIKDSQPEPAHVPYGRCRRHPQVVISNGMFDGLCYLCEADDDFAYADRS